MAKSLPDSIEIANAVRKSWQLSGTVMLSDLERLPTHLIKKDKREVRFEIVFQPCDGIIGKAHIKIESDIELICQRSLAHFDFKLKVDREIGFISQLEDESKLVKGMAPSWVEGDFITPKDLIEDEMLLVIPEFPIKPGSQLETDYITNQKEQKTAEGTHNPFSVLKDLK